jgi:hypothetical protein
MHDTILIAKQNGVLEVFKVIVESFPPSVKVVMQACYSLPHLDQHVRYAYIEIDRNPTAGSAYTDIILEAEETTGSGQAAEWMPLCYTRMDERILGEVSGPGNTTRSHIFV